MSSTDMKRDHWLLGLALTLLLPVVVSAAGPESYRFPREPGTTKDGYPLPLTGKPITKTPVIAKAGRCRQEVPGTLHPGEREPR